MKYLPCIAYLLKFRGRTLRGPKDSRGGENKWTVTGEYKELLDANKSMTEEDSISNFVIKQPAITDIEPDYRPFTPPFSQLNFTASKNTSKTNYTKKYNPNTDIKQPINKPNIRSNVGEDDKLLLIYDEILNCYYDPLTGNYYQST